MSSAGKSYHKKLRAKKNISPKIFVLSGPGGAGKTTLLKRLFHKKFIKDNFLKAISLTTRQRRFRERKGKDYLFVSKKEFLNLKRKGFFLETQKVLEDYYGTPKYFYREALKKKKNLILCIDVKGGMYLKRKLKPDRIVTVFISVPKQLLYRRLKKRRESERTIKKRLTLAKKELQFSKRYDYLIINQELKTTLKNLETVLRRETLRG
jgi:guanylate kinase